MFSRAAALALVAALTLPLAACGDGLDRGGAPDAIGLALPAEGEARQAKAAWGPLVEDMEAATGLRVAPFFGSNDAALVEAMRFGQAQVGLLPAKGALEAARRAEGEVFARAAGPGEGAGAAMVWRKDLDPAIKEKVRQFLFTYGQGQTERAARERENLQRLALAGFAPADETLLLPARETEARMTLQAARRGGDPGRIEAAESELEDVRRRRLELQAKAGRPVAAP